MHMWTAHPVVGVKDSQWEMRCRPCFAGHRNGVSETSPCWVCSQSSNDDFIDAIVKFPISTGKILHLRTWIKMSRANLDAVAHYLLVSRNTKQCPQWGMSAMCLSMSIYFSEWWDRTCIYSATRVCEIVVTHLCLCEGPKQNAFLEPFSVIMRQRDLGKIIMRGKELRRL